jgi:hypothetical protein
MFEMLTQLTEPAREGAILHTEFVDNSIQIAASNC